MQEQIDKETQIIKELENSYPLLDTSVGIYHPNNTPWHIHHTKVRDAYWRRRMLKTKLEGGNLEQTARIY